MWIFDQLAEGVEAVAQPSDNRLPTGAVVRRKANTAPFKETESGSMLLGHHAFTARASWSLAAEQPRPERDDADGDAADGGEPLRIDYLDYIYVDGIIG